jgi:hypothetical protein
MSIPDGWEPIRGSEFQGRRDLTVVDWLIIIMHLLGARLHRTTARGPGALVVQVDDPLREAGNKASLVLSTS